MKKGPILLLGLALIAVVIAGIYLHKNWDDYFGPAVDKFYNFSYKEDESRPDEIRSTNTSIFNISSKLYAKNNMYNFEISIINRSNNIKKIIAFNSDIPASKILFAGTNIYPQLSVLSNTYSFSWLDLRISFIDIDGHQKSRIETIKINLIRPAMNYMIEDRTLALVAAIGILIGAMIMIIFCIRIIRRIIG
ncbi:MAG: hypothetical protein PHQ34_11540 [Methanothrix sp.]|nr:hypothetical protein [Methanothrix sp.]